MTVGYGVDVIGGSTWASPGGASRGRITWNVVSRPSLPSLPGALDGDDWRLEYDHDRLWVSIVDGASFSLRLPVDGEADVAAHLDGWSLEKAWLFFLMGVLPLALPRLGTTPLHGAAFSLDGESACIMMGDSGNGKTTTLAHHLSKGAAFLSDDASAIDERGMLWPAPPYWASRDEPIGGQADYIGKAVRLATHTLAGPVPVACTIWLRPARGAVLEVERVQAHEALLAVIANQRSPWLFTGRREQSLRLAATAAVACLPVGIARYDQDRHSPDDLVEAIGTWIASLPTVHEAAAVQ